MAENSRIEWTDNTHNFWIGCTKVGPACDICYAENFGRRLKVKWGKGQPRRRTSHDNWLKPLAWNRQAQAKGVRFTVFSNSLSDIFDTEVPEEWRYDAFRLIDQTPYLDWLILTKRSKPAMTRLTDESWWKNAIGRVPENMQLPQIWLGNTVEDQKHMDMRWRWMRDTPAAVKFLSMEPLLSDVVLPADFLALGQRAWVIVGGESGNGERPTHPLWVQNLCGQAVGAAVPFHFKQWGDWMPVAPFSARPDLAQWGPAVTSTGIMKARHTVTLADGSPLVGDLGQTEFKTCFVDGQQFMRVGKHAAGRLLDGRTWDERPVSPLAPASAGRLL